MLPPHVVRLCTWCDSSALFIDQLQIALLHELKLGYCYLCTSSWLYTHNLESSLRQLRKDSITRSECEHYIAPGSHTFNP